MWHHDVKDNEVRHELFRNLHSLPAILYNLDLETLLFKIVCQQFQNVPVVIHHQYTERSFLTHILRANLHSRCYPVFIAQLSGNEDLAVNGIAVNNRFTSSPI